MKRNLKGGMEGDVDGGKEGPAIFCEYSSRFSKISRKSAKKKKRRGEGGGEENVKKREKGQEERGKMVGKGRREKGVWREE